MIDAPLAELLALLQREDGASLPKLAKRLGLPQSQLLRHIARLGADQSIGGLGFVELRGEQPARLFLTATGRAWLEHAHEA